MINSVTITSEPIKFFLKNNRITALRSHQTHNAMIIVDPQRSNLSAKRRDTADPHIFFSKVEQAAVEAAKTSALHKNEKHRHHCQRS